MSAPVPRLLGGRYEVGDLIGRGGMAEVHIGHDTRLGRPVAIKILRSDHVRDASFLGRFRREAQSVANLNHRSIVSVYDSGEDETIESGGARVPVPFIVMEHVDGKTLRDLLNERGRLNPVEAARIVEGVLDALGYSHRMGMVHRDIKPANVMIAHDGSVKVMDFGIARAMADTQATMTQTSSVMGTAQYISPEQAEGHAVDSRSDLYSTGCLLFELLTGRTPFTGEPVALTYQHVTKPPPLPSSLNPAVPDDLDAIVVHALAKDPALRYQDAEHFRSDLHAYRLGLPISAAARAALGANASTTVLRQTPEPYAARPPGPTRPVPDRDTAALRTALTEPERRSRGATIALAMALIAALGLLGYAARIYLDSRPEQIAVPRVTGLPIETAEARLGQAKFDVSKTFVPDPEAPVDEVIAQDPEALTMQNEGALITLTVSTGPAEAQVPDVSGLTEDEARAKIEEAGLVVGEIREADSAEHPEGEVISTEPAAFTAAVAGDRVDLRVATGQVTLPDLTGRTEDDARQVLVELRLPVTTETEESDQPEGTVIDQDPDPGKVDVGASVTLTLARSKPVTSTTTVTETPTSTSSTESTTTSSTTTSTTDPTSSTLSTPPSGEDTASALPRADVAGVALLGGLGAGGLYGASRYGAGRYGAGRFGARLLPSRRRPSRRH